MTVHLALKPESTGLCSSIDSAARSIDGCANNRSLDGVARSIDSADRSIARNSSKKNRTDDLLSCTFVISLTNCWLPVHRAG